MIGLCPIGTDLESVFIRLVERADGKGEGVKPRRGRARS
jgi:hypothetical protein